jgi:NAD-dependent dihydropyrimidine dehydrogenase PreA subunit
LPIKIDPNKCDGCGICVYDCGANVIHFTAKKDKVFPFGNKQCVNCFLCELVCPEKAIEVVFTTPKRDKTEAAV